MDQPTIDDLACSHGSIGMMDSYSLEVTAKDGDALRAAAAHIPPGTSISVTFLPGEDMEARIGIARLVRELGFEPMPHFSARNLLSYAEFQTYLDRLVVEAGVRRCFVIAGDRPEPIGPFRDSLTLIETGAFERARIEMVGVGGFPEGHPHLSAEKCWHVLLEKCAAIAARGMEPLIVTQFGFDSAVVIEWLSALRARNVATLVRLGVPGPAGIKTLMRFAARCGVGASASVLAKYGISITHLMGSAGPDALMTTLAKGLGPQHGPVHLHFYPFGGVGKTLEWIADYQARNHCAAPNKRA